MRKKIDSDCVRKHINVVILQWSQEAVFQRLRFQHNTIIFSRSLHPYGCADFFVIYALTNPFIFPHFSLNTLTNINILATHPNDNIYLRRKNK